MSKVIDVYDDVFEEHNAIILDDNVKQIHWKYDYYSNKNEVNKHWHILCGHDKEECSSAGYDWADEMFYMFKTELILIIIIIMIRHHQEHHHHHHSS